MSPLWMLLFLFPSIILASLDVIEEGDILIPVEVRGMQERNEWPGGIVSYKISSGFSQDEILEIRGAMWEIEQKTCVRFKEVDFWFGSYVNFVYGDQCASFVGNIGRFFGQKLYLGHGCFHRQIILHEIMHALGFIHEHNRSDRDDYIVVNDNNIKPDARHNFKKNLLIEETHKNSKYAYDSIMHYGAHDFAINPAFPVLQAKRPFRGVMGGGTQLSPVDIDRINAYYKCPTFTRTTTKEPVSRLLYLGPDIHKITRLAGTFCMPVSGFQPDPTNCFRYLQCVHGRYMSRPCAPGTSFHADRGGCFFVNMSKCG